MRDELTCPEWVESNSFGESVLTGCTGQTGEVGLVACRAGAGG